MLPSPPPVAELRAAGLHPDEVIDWPATDIVWRVHRTTGGHTLSRDGLREFGPILRFDHHPPPTR
ncbi:hypothetical protein [Rhodococcus artemisiae]|uniref:hypothetical protein n=1 Tax=Rhodococcus artemisiae TaxID=714159 RepID=UPI002E7B94F3|nr:hypothetical protein [Rhodococcus artemisiae]